VKCARLNPECQSQHSHCPLNQDMAIKKTTTWVRCSLFGKRAEGGLIQYLVKGQSVSVQGEIKLNTYTNKEGVEKSSLDLMVNDLALLGKPTERNTQPKQQSDPFARSVPVDDEPPF